MKKEIPANSSIEKALKEILANSSIEKALNVHITNGCKIDIKSVITLLDLDGNPVVEIDTHSKRAMFLGDYHQTAGCTEGLQDLITALEAEGFSMFMD